MKNTTRYNNHLSKNCLNDLWEIKSSLNGISSLFMQETKNAQFNEEEFYGIGVFIKKLSDDLSSVEEALKNKE